MNNETSNKLPEIDSNYQKIIESYHSINDSGSLNNLDLDFIAALPTTKMESEFEFKISVFDVAAYILSKIGSTTTMKLHKLLYYCQAWSLVWDEEALFQERIEAWANGPVIRDLFSYHRGFYTIEKISIGNPKLLGEKQRETIDAVLKHYGDKSSQWLIELTHLEEPWKRAREGMGQTERGHNPITWASMAEYYSSL